MAGMTQTIVAAIDKENRSIFSIYSAIFRGQSILAIPWSFRTCVRCTAAKGWMTWRRWIWRAFPPTSQTHVNNLKHEGQTLERGLSRQGKRKYEVEIGTLCISLHLFAHASWADVSQPSVSPLNPIDIYVYIYTLKPTWQEGWVFGIWFLGRWSLESRLLGQEILNNILERHGWYPQDKGQRLDAVNCARTQTRELHVQQHADWIYTAIYESVIIYVYCNFHMLRTNLHLVFSFGQCFHHSHRLFHDPHTITYVGHLSIHRICWLIHHSFLPDFSAEVLAEIASSCPWPLKLSQKTWEMCTWGGGYDGRWTM